VTGWLRRWLRRTPAPVPAAAAVLPVPPGDLVHLAVLLPCSGWCRGRTVHEDDGAGTATCISCGTPRSSYDPDEDDLL
jgi:hypothetical protein